MNINKQLVTPGEFFFAESIKMTFKGLGIW